MQQRVSSIGTIFVGLGRPMAMSNRTLVHRRTTLHHAILKTLINKNTIRWHSSKGFHCKQGGKQPIDVREVQHFFTQSIPKGSSKTPTSNAFCGSDVDSNSKSSKKRHVKQFLKTWIGDNVQYGLHNLISKVEEKVSMKLWQ